MTLRKSNLYLSLVNSYLIDSPQPSSLNYWWNLGSLLGLCLIIQIASGLFLAMHYSSNIELAFNAVEHIMRDVNAGWLIRYIHANGASFFFICMYLHIAKAMYYGSYKSPRIILWTVGVIILVLTIATAFMGYNLSSPKSYYKYNTKYMLNTKRYISTPKSRDLGYTKRYISTKSTLNVKDMDISKAEDLFKDLCIEPEIWWDNLDKGIIRDKMRNELKNKSGIYIIINKITRNYYIGSAQTNNLYKRVHSHLFSNGRKGSTLVFKAVNKYGLNNFIYGILEYYPYEVNRYNNEELLALETSYISLLAPKYNILTEAEQFYGYKNKEINLSNKLNLINLLLTNERKELLKSIKIKHNEELKTLRHNHLSNIALNRPIDYLSEEGKINISKSKSKTIFISSSLDDNSILCKFKSINTAAHYLCCSSKTIQRSLHLGWIYVPNSFIPLLNQNHIDNNNSIIEFIPKYDISLYNYTHSKYKSIKLKASLCNYNNFTKVYISSILTRYL